MTVQRRLAAILAADVVGYSASMGKDEEGTLARLKSLRRDVIEPKVDEHRGRIFKTTGDGFLVEFSSPVEAVRCAVGVQQACAGDAHGLQLRIGINLGDIIVEEDGDVYGDGVNVAARLEQLAPPGGVCISSKIHEEVRDKLPYAFEDLGEQQVKNIARPVRAYRLLGASASSGLKPGPAAAGTRAKAFGSIALLFSVALFGIGAVAVGGFVWWTRSDGEAALHGYAPTVLVLPLEVADSQERTRLFADGLTEDLIIALSRFSGLRVLGRNTSNSLGGTAADLGKLHRDHRVNYLVRGTLSTLGEQITLRAQLVDTASGVARWNERFEPETGQALKALDEAAGRIASTVAVRVSRVQLEEARRKPAVSLNAYELTLRGRQLWQRPSREALAEARAFFLRAAELDPHYAAPLAYAAFTHLTAFNNAWSDEFAQPAALQRMLDLAGRALEIDADFATAYAAQAVAYVYLGRHDEAQAAAARALASNPNDTDVLGRIGQVQSFSGTHRDAITTLKRAIELDPFGPAQWFNFLSRAHFFLGEDAAAISAARTCLDRSKIQPCQETLVAALALSGESEAAARGWRELTAERRQIAPEALVSRLRPAFRNRADLDRLVDGLKRASEQSSRS